jgi:uncharacterized membrane protein
MFRKPGSCENGGMKILTFAKNTCMDSGNFMSETSRQSLTKQLTRVIAVNLMCLFVFIAFCALATFGSLSVLLSFWSEHRAASVIVIMISIVAIPSVIELAVSRLGFWQR